MALESLPINEALPRLLSALEQHRSVVLQAPPGAGKSTGVPLALLNAQWCATKKIVMLEPRRLAARAVATRMASQLNEPVGRTVGYRTRLDSKVTNATRIEVVTEGILTRRLQRDAALEDTAIVIFDEFHERNLQADLGLALCLDTQEQLRDDLKILVMSATLDGDAIAKLLGSAPIVTSEGRAFPVDIHYRTKVPGRDDDIVRVTATTIQRALDENDGDLLVFLPGQGEIRRVQRLLEEVTLPKHVDVFPLFGELSPAEQDAAIRPSVAGRRKIVLTTNIAETSLTIEGVRVVIDSGLARRARFDPSTGMSRLDTMRISRASSEQRRGRAGRLQPGVCYRLWTETEQAALAAHTPAEMMETDLTPLALELASWGTHDPQSLRWLDAPPQATFTQARELLMELQALQGNKITNHGRAMASIAAHPRLAHMLLRAQSIDQGRLAAELAAIVGERDLLRFSSGTPKSRDANLRLRVDALRGQSLPSGVEVDRGARQRVLQSAEQIYRQLTNSDKRSVTSTNADEHIGLLLAWAFPDRIAQSRAAGGRYLLSGGRGAMLVDAQLLAKEEFLVVAELDDSDREARIRLAAAISRADIETHLADLIVESSRVEWDAREHSVVARGERMLGALTISSRKLEPSADDISAAMLKGIRALSLDALPWTSEARALQARMEFLRRIDTHAPERWPAVSDGELFANLEQWLGPWLNGMTRRDHLSRLDLHATLLAMLSWPQQTRLNEFAPTHLHVPSGSNIPIDYTTDPPTLAVRLQEVFGLLTTPKVGGGRVSLLLQLLSPARRPVQTTQDLASFWARGYHDVKKDLKGRYPKHYWPDDPLQAQATARAKPRNT
jgi:ATP-dependent helicase HrpB